MLAAADGRYFVYVTIVFAAAAAATLHDAGHDDDDDAEDEDDNHDHYRNDHNKGCYYDSVGDFACHFIDADCEAVSASATDAEDNCFCSFHGFALGDLGLCCIWQRGRSRKTNLAKSLCRLCSNGGPQAGKSHEP